MPNPEKVVKKAGKKVGKALSVFEKAAVELEDASAQQVIAASILEDRSHQVAIQAEQDADAAYAAAKEAYEAALLQADVTYTAQVQQADELSVRADEIFDAADESLARAENLRNLLSIA